ncbi:hypothetical protein J7E88_14765 [Streptomyces sp. ISL-10]|uniref:hypothetical protein n=1 Tax=Streptomyces sp. ISL-10 TaxID=2819172 RepID=UPI001BEB31C9|nr:hypothetical protein [Streptomyces sp. ISL-10]MBT2366536.1 hypothetical protein [Streptomyces sp. ISL-10]
MGWTVLYIAFGIVALWLLGEVLLQYKARLRWRVLAFTGFLGVVVGVLLPSVVVIALGTAAFAVGQTYVTLSFRRGFSTGWALGGSPGVSRRRRSAGPAAEREPTLEVTELSYESYEPPADTERRGPEAPAVYEPQPLPDDTGQYGIYTDDAYAAPQHASQQVPDQEQSQAYAQYGADHTGYGAYDAYGDYGQPQQPGHESQYAYDAGQQQYAAYADPYAGGQQYAASYGSYDAYGGPQQYADPYAQQYGDTPPGGVWAPQVPQQRDGDQFPPMPQEEPTPYGYDTGAGHTEQQYRY